MYDDADGYIVNTGQKIIALQLLVRCEPEDNFEEIQKIYNNIQSLIRIFYNDPMNINSVYSWYKQTETQ